MCFRAAGNTSCSDKKASSHDYERKILAGDKPLTNKTRGKFPTPIDSESLVNFFIEKVDENKANDALSSFGIPKSSSIKLDLFAKALSSQFQLFISNSDKTVDDIVATEYQKLLVSAESYSAPTTTPLYIGDNAWFVNDIPSRTINVECYEKFQYTWTILNNGNQTWQKRTLFFKNSAAVRPRADNIRISIPDVCPTQDIKITASFDARGFEGIFDCIWVMEDTDEKNCFPNSENIFKISINVTHK